MNIMKILAQEKRNESMKQNKEANKNILAYKLL